LNQRFGGGICEADLYDSAISNSDRVAILQRGCSIPDPRVIYKGAVRRAFVSDKSLAALKIECSVPARKTVVLSNRNRGSVGPADSEAFPFSERLFSDQAARSDVKDDLNHCVATLIVDEHFAYGQISI
jgi:hypothetical protein